MARTERMAKTPWTKHGLRKKERYHRLIESGPNANYLERIGPESTEYLESYDADALFWAAGRIAFEGLNGSLDTVSFKKIEIDTVLLGAITEFCNIRHHLSQENPSMIYMTLEEISFKEYYQGLKINEQIIRNNKRGIKNVRDVLEVTYQIVKSRRNK